MFMACLLPPGYLNNEIKGGVMKKKTFIFVTFVLMYLMVPFMAMPGELHNRPVAVSPGSDTDAVVAVAGNCPTFSWSGVAGAVSYRVVVFEAAEVLAYEEMEAIAQPVISKEIHGPALSWTPSMDEALRTGSMYVWYVRSVDKSGFGEWSTGNKFKVEASPGLFGLIENLKKRFKEFGVEAGVVNEVFKGIEPGEEEETASGDDKNAVISDNPPAGITGSENDGSNVYYGSGAGDALYSSGNANCFFGLNAGALTNSGDENSFFGYFSGYVNTSGSYNSFFGMNAGSSNSWGFSNTFIGHKAGKSNTQGLMNVYIGANAGEDNVDGALNVLIGCEAGADKTAGSENVFIGNQAGKQNTSGTGNIFIGKSAAFYETGSNKLYIDNSSTSSPLIYGEFNNDLLKINGNLRVTGYLSLDNGTTTIDATELNLLNGKTSVSTGSTNNNILVTKGYVDENDDVGGGLTGDAMTNQYICKWDDGNIRLVNSLISESGGYILINGSLQLNSHSLSLDNGSHWITSNEINILDGKTLVTGGSSDNDKLVTKGYVDASDDVGGGLTGSYLTDKCISKWDDTNTRLVDSLISENAGAVNINGTLGIGTSTPDVPVHLVTPSGTTAKVWLESTGGSKLQMTGAPTSGQFGTVSNHQLRLVTNATWKMVVEPDGKVGIGVLSPTHLLHLNGGAYSDGNTWTPASSRELKENIDALTGKEAMTAFEKLNPVKFNYKNNKTEDYIGFIAEDVPDLLSTRDRKGVNTMDVVALLTKVLQEQQKTVRKQTKIIDELRARIKKLENENSKPGGD
jgi:hypothetical protein